MCNPLSLSPDEGVDARMYQEQLLMADLYMLEAYDALNHCGLIQPERDALEAQARELDARGLHGNARAIRSLKNDFYYLVAAACDSMAEQHNLLEAHTNRLQSSGGKDMKNDEQQQ